MPLLTSGLLENFWDQLEMLLQQLRQKYKQYIDQAALLYIYKMAIQKIESRTSYDFVGRKSQGNIKSPGQGMHSHLRTTVNFLFK